MLHGQKTILKPRDMVFRPMNVAHPGVCDTIKNAFTQHGAHLRGAVSVDNSAPQAANRRATSSRVASHSAAGEK